MDIESMVIIFNIGARLQDKMYENECYEQQVKERDFCFDKMRRNVI